MGRLALPGMARASLSMHACAVSASETLVGNNGKPLYRLAYNYRPKLQQTLRPQFLSAGAVCHHGGFKLPHLLTDFTSFMWTRRAWRPEHPGDGTPPATIVEAVECLDPDPAMRAGFAAHVRGEIARGASLVRADLQERLDGILHAAGADSGKSSKRNDGVNQESSCDITLATC